MTHAMASALELSYFGPDERQGYVQWSLFRTPREEMQFPNETELQRCFEQATGMAGTELTVDEVRQFGCYLRLPVGAFRKSCSGQQFVAAVEVACGLRPKVQAFSMAYWPDNRSTAADGYSPWMLSSLTNSGSQKPLPGTKALRQCFHEATGLPGNTLTVRKRYPEHCYVDIPKALPRDKRLAFLGSLERMSLATS